MPRRRPVFQGSPNGRKSSQYKALHRPTSDRVACHVISVGGLLQPDSARHRLMFVLGPWAGDELPPPLWEIPTDHDGRKTAVTENLD